MSMELIRVSLAVCLEELDRQDEAVSFYRYVAEAFPDSPFAWQAKSRLENF